VNTSEVFTNGAGISYWVRIGSPVRTCAVQRFGSSRGCETHPATLSFQPESSRSGGGGNETVKAFGVKGSLWRLSELAGRNVSEHQAGPENGSGRSQPSVRKGKAAARGAGERQCPAWSCRGNGDGKQQGEDPSNTGNPTW
jgi:hypothetical protein